MNVTTNMGQILAADCCELKTKNNFLTCRNVSVQTTDVLDLCWGLYDDRQKMFFKSLFRGFI